MTFADIPTSPVPAYQELGEFGPFWEFIASRPHASVLEIGSLYGGTLWYWARLPAIDSLVSVDRPPTSGQMGADIQAARSQWRGWFPNVEFTDIPTNSHDPQTVEAVRHRGPFDFAFIDGDHTYDGVRQDWLLYSPMVRPGGVVAFHDTWPTPKRHEPGVVAWVEELRHLLPSVQWTAPEGAGIAAFILPGTAA